MMSKNLFGKGKLQLFSVILVVAMLLCMAIPAYAAEQRVSIELEDLEYQKTDEVFLESPFKHGALPVESVVNLNFYRAGNQIETSFSIEKEGIYVISLGYVMNNDSGVLEMKIDGTVIDDAINLKNNGGWEIGNKKTGLMRLAKGEHTLTFTSKEAAGYTALLDYLCLEEMTVSDEFVFEFEGNAYTKSDEFHLEANYKHEALPVDAIVNVNFYEAGRTLETVSLIVAEEGKYTVSFAYILNNDNGSVQISIDGRKLGEAVNLHHDGGWTLAEQELGEIELAAGIHKVSIQSIDDGSGRYCAQLDALKLKKTAEAVDPVNPVIPDPGTDEPSKPNEPSNPTTGDVSLLVFCAAAVLLLTGLGVFKKRYDTI